MTNATNHQKQSLTPSRHTDTNTHQSIIPLYHSSMLSAELTQDVHYSQNSDNAGYQFWGTVIGIN